MPKYHEVNILCNQFLTELSNSIPCETPTQWLANHQQDPRLYTASLASHFQITLDKMLDAIPPWVRGLSLDERIKATPNSLLREKLANYLPSLQVYITTLRETIEQTNQILAENPHHHPTCVLNINSLQSVLHARINQKQTKDYINTRDTQAVIDLEILDFEALIQAIRNIPEEIADLVISFVEGTAIDMLDWNQCRADIKREAMISSNKVVTFYNQLQTCLELQAAKQEAHDRKVTKINLIIQRLLQAIASLMMGVGLYLCWYAAQHPQLGHNRWNLVLMALASFITGLGIFSSNFPPSKRTISWSIITSSSVLLFQYWPRISAFFH